MPKKSGAINGGIQRRGHRAITPTIVVQVKSVEATLKKVKSASGHIGYQRKE